MIFDDQKNEKSIIDCEVLSNRLSKSGQVRVGFENSTLRIDKSRLTSLTNEWTYIEDHFRWDCLDVPNGVMMSKVPISDRESIRSGVCIDISSCCVERIKSIESKGSIRIQESDVKDSRITCDDLHIKHTSLFGCKINAKSIMFQDSPVNPDNSITAPHVDIWNDRISYNISALYHNDDISMINAIARASKSYLPDYNVIAYECKLAEFFKDFNPAIQYGLAGIIGLELIRHYASPSATLTFYRDTKKKYMGNSDPIDCADGWKFIFI